MRLSEVKAGDTIEITSLPNPIIRAQAIRLGIYEGAVIRCSEKINKGPVILQNRLQEIAIGHKLASQIIVEIITDHRSAKNEKKGPSLSYGYK
ncbi:FeoA family protein [Vallitalea okinawensis]|uniref:FeoA family protein n=1 Tax=Vallitalea okinawensis TaxID=2078660 RepID=UPI000CFCA44E|nr:ferrous iron transport protein A [Vallitalea okinawensis]